MITISKPLLGKEEIDAVNEVLLSGVIVQGPKVKELEQQFAAYCGTRYAVALNSGTAAIHAGLYALGITAGDEVITSPFTFVASANPIVMLGGRVVFVDIEEADYMISPDQISRAISPKTKAILPVDLYGQIYNYEAVRILAEKNNLKILEDACQAIGAGYPGQRKAGTCGDIGAFSLYATKNIMCGEGGLVTTDSAELAEKVRQFRHHGQSEQVRYEYLDLGYNYRLTDMAAAIALVQLKKVDMLNERRISHARQLTAGLEGISGIILPTVKPGFKHVFHQYTIRVTSEAKLNRDALLSALKDNDVIGGIYYPKPLHLHPHFQKMGYARGDFPVAEKVADEVLSLPIHPGLAPQDIDRIISVIKKYAS